MSRLKATVDLKVADASLVPEGVCEVSQPMRVAFRATRVANDRKELVLNM
jgi:hypothetical protein